MQLISTPRYSTLLNGNPSTPFSSTRGILQGDPLSPFIFVLMAEGLVRLIYHAASKNTLKVLSLYDDQKLTHE